MKKIALIALAIVFAGPALAEHCNVRLIDQTAFRLQNESRTFAGVIRSVQGDSHAYQVAGELAEAAEALHELAHHGAQCREIDASFHEVEEVFEHLSGDVAEDHALHHNPTVNAHFARLTQAFQAVNQAVHGAPAPRPVTVNLHLASNNHQPNSQVMPGLVQSMNLVRQHSGFFGRCVAGTSFGFDGNTIWVKYGCRGDFSVTYLAR